MSCHNESEKGNITHIRTKDVAAISIPATENENGITTWQGHRSDIMTACRLYSLPLGYILESGDFQPVHAYEYSENGQRRIRFQAKYLGLQAWARRPGGKYTLVFDPEHGYRLLSSVIEVSPKHREEQINTYWTDGERYSPQTVNVETVDMNYTERQLLTFNIPKPCTIPDEEFYLPHYGFSEAVLETLHPNPWPRWILTALGIVALAIGAWLFRGKPRPRTQDS